MTRNDDYSSKVSCCDNSWVNELFFSYCLALLTPSTRLTLRCSPRHVFVSLSSRNARSSDTNRFPSWFSTTFTFLFLSRLLSLYVGFYFVYYALNKLKIWDQEVQYSILEFSIWLNFVVSFCEEEQFNNAVRGLQFQQENGNIEMKMSTINPLSFTFELCQCIAEWIRIQISTITYRRNLRIFQQGELRLGAFR